MPPRPACLMCMSASAPPRAAQQWEMIGRRVTITYFTHRQLETVVVLEQCQTLAMHGQLDVLILLLVPST